MSIQTELIFGLQHKRFSFNYNSLSWPHFVVLRCADLLICRGVEINDNSKIKLLLEIIEKPHKILTFDEIKNFCVRNIKDEVEVEADWGYINIRLLS